MVRSGKRKVMAKINIDTIMKMAPNTISLAMLTSYILVLFVGNTAAGTDASTAAAEHLQPSITESVYYKFADSGQYW